MQIRGVTVAWWQWVVAAVALLMTVAMTVAIINQSDAAAAARWQDQQKTRQIDTLISEQQRKDREAAVERRHLLAGQAHTNEILAAVLENLRRRGIFIDPGILVGLTDTHSDDRADHERAKRQAQAADAGGSGKAPDGSNGDSGSGGGSGDSGSHGKSGDSHGKSDGKGHSGEHGKPDK